MSEGIQVDFLPVGEGEHSGDAIAIRWHEGNRFRVMAYDGGTQDCGAKLAQHIFSHFNTTHIDFLVNSHPDNDHAGGLAYLVENMTIGQVWMHRPWLYSAHIRQYFHDGRITDASLAERLKRKMAAAHRLEQAALARRIPVYEPFAGQQIGIFTVLSPTQNRYVHELIPAFEKSPELKMESAFDAVFGFVRKAVQYVAGEWHLEYLPEDVATSAENESSAILFAPMAGRGVLLTGDAGVESLKAAAQYALARGVYLPTAVQCVQIPHHGGRHNVSTETLNMLLGGPLPRYHDEPERSACVSASAGAPSHPKRVVTNAFIRRGFKVGQTKGDGVCYTDNMPARAGWMPIAGVPFHTEVEG